MGADIRRPSTSTGGPPLGNLYARSKPRLEKTWICELPTTLLSAAWSSPHTPHAPQHNPAAPSPLHADPTHHVPYATFLRYQFGVYTGGTMRSIARRVSGFGRLWGFDSFTGLPAETKGKMLEGKHWRPGGFSAADALRNYNRASLLEQILSHIDRNNTQLIPGYFNESLTPELTRRFSFRPALVVDVDVDLHSSTMQCMTWMLENRLLVPGLTYVRYDDWRKPRQWWGEATAHQQLSDRYQLLWRRISMKEYQLMSVGKWRGKSARSKEGGGLHRAASWLPRG